MKNNFNWNNISTFKTLCAAALLLAGIRGVIASDQVQGDPASLIKVTGTGCAGSYNAIAKMTNSSGTYWLTPPPGTTNAIFQDASGFPAPYASSIVVVRRSDLNSWCTNSPNVISIPVSTSTTYEFTVYVTSTPPPPTNNQPMTLKINWQ